MTFVTGQLAFATDGTVIVVDLVMTLVNFVNLILLFILQMTKGGCGIWFRGHRNGTCDDDQILHGPLTAQGTYYLFVYWLCVQITSRTLMRCTCLPDVCREFFLMMWLWFWYFTPVMYLVVVSMVFSELDFWTGLGGLAITWIVFLCIGLVMQCAKCAWFTGYAMKNASSQQWVNDRGSSSSSYQSVPVLDYGSVENPIVGAPVVGQPMCNTQANYGIYH